MIFSFSDNKIQIGLKASKGGVGWGGCALEHNIGNTVHLTQCTYFHLLSNCFKMTRNKLSLAKDPVYAMVPGDGTWPHWKPDLCKNVVVLDRAQVCQTTKNCSFKFYRNIVMNSVFLPSFV